jgi:hypothetical protein
MLAVILLYVSLCILAFVFFTRAQGYDKSMLLVVYITMVIVVFEYSLYLMNFLTEVSEQTPDAVEYAAYGHWSFSLKNPYYDLINVSSFWIALLHILLGVGDIVDGTPNIMLYFVIALLISLSAWVIYQRNKSKGRVLPAMILAFASPYITFISIPPALSAMFALIALTLIFSDRVLRLPDYIAVIILATAGMFTHATAVSILIFSILSILVLSKVYGEIPVGYLHILSTLATLYVVLVLIRFIYTTAYVAIRPYYGDFLRFLNFLASLGGVELRITRYEQWAPLFTSFSWTVYPALSVAYVLFALFRKRRSRTELFALALSLAGLILVSIGFIGSRFSNSFSREVAYPGYMLLFLSSFEALRKVDRDKVGRVVIMILIVFAVISGIFTIKNTPWFYVGKVPFLTYRPPTPSETLLVEKLLTLLNSTNEFRSIELIQSFDPITYIVKMIELRLIKPSNTLSPPPINVQATFDNIQNNNVVINSPSLYVLWR